MRGLSLTCVLLLSFCTLDQAERQSEPLTVFCAASTTEVLGDVVRKYEKKTGQKVRLSFASSSTLAHQIGLGAKADIFISANPRWVDYLRKKQLVKKAKPLLRNQLALITSVKEKDRFNLQLGIKRNFADLNRLAIGNPDHVPAGIYAKQALEQLGWWDDLRSRLLPTRDVREALQVVELGEAELGIVYATDALASTKVSVVFLFPKNSSEPILYPAALCGRSQSKAQVFYDYLWSPDALAIYQQYGFQPLED